MGKMEKYIKKIKLTGPTSVGHGYIFHHVIEFSQRMKSTLLSSVNHSRNFRVGMTVNIELETGNDS